MAKKSKSRKYSKRNRSQQQPRRQAAAPIASTTTATGTARATTGRQRTAATPRAVDFSQEYAYVYTDLKKVAVIAAAMVLILVVLAFVLA
jgi:hypothetical protein